MDKDQILKAAVAAASQQQQAPMTVQPQPVPMSLQLSTAQDPSGKKLLVLSLFTPTGQAVYFLDPDGAENLAKSLLETARSARSGLEIVRPGGLT